MKYAQVYLCDTANGTGCRTSLFVSGCAHHCKGCFNPEAQDFGYGKEFTQEVQDRLIKESNHPYIDGFTILGGEPMEISNQGLCVRFWKESAGNFPARPSGYTPGTHGKN